MYIDILEFERYLSIMINRGRRLVAARLMANHLNSIAEEEGTGSVAYTLNREIAKSHGLMEHLEIVYHRHQLREMTVLA